MAIVIPQRRAYKPRHIVEYVRNNVLCLRSNCSTLHQPHTLQQRCFQNRFMLIHTLQCGITPLFKRGFHTQRSPKNRVVGAFHVAQGINMNQAALLQNDGITWRCNFSRFTICEHKSKAPKRITLQREEHLLLLSYTWHGHAERTSLLWAVYNSLRNAWVYGIEDTHLGAKTTACAIPPAWKDAPLEVLIGFGMDAEGRGKLRGTHHFSFGESKGVVTVRGNKQGVPEHTPTQRYKYTLTACHIGLPSPEAWIEIKNSTGLSIRLSVWYLLE